MHYSETLRDMLDHTVDVLKKRHKKEKASTQFWEDYALANLRVDGFLIETEINGVKIYDLRPVTPEDVERAKGAAEASEIHLNAEVSLECGVLEWLNFSVEAYRLHHPKEKASDDAVAQLLFKEMEGTKELILEEGELGKFVMRLGTQFPNDAAKRRLELLVNAPRRVDK